MQYLQKSGEKGRKVIEGYEMMHEHKDLQPECSFVESRQEMEGVYKDKVSKCSKAIL